MKNPVVDKFSKVGRLRLRLDEVQALVARQELSRMEAGDQIGRQIAAPLSAVSPRSTDESRLLFEAQCVRAKLYQLSSGATALEAAEALADAHAVLREFTATEAESASLLPISWAILQDLVRIGSRRNAWTTFGVLFDAMEATTDHKDFRAPVIELFSSMIKSLLEEKSDSGILPMLMRVAEWARRNMPEKFSDVVQLLPHVIVQGLDKYPVEQILEAYLFSRHLCVGFDAKIVRRIVVKLAESGLRTTEVRTIYHDFLGNEIKLRARVETHFETLAQVSADPAAAWNDDLDALNEMLSEFYGECTWVWRNRALLYRQKKDPVAAIACLARALNISGQPPEIMGLLAPNVLAMGFDQAAQVFASFVSPDDREKYCLGVLDDLGEEPKTDEQRRSLLSRLKQWRTTRGLPAEYIRPIDRRSADLLLELGLLDRAADILETLRHEDPADEQCVLKLVDVAYRRGDHTKARTLIQGNFSTRWLPLALHLRSRFSEDDGLAADAVRDNQAALEALETAQHCGREQKQKSLVALATRIVRMFGKDHTNSALLAVLESEVFGTRHVDLEHLRTVLERRAVDLAVRGRDPEAARSAVVALAESHPEDREILFHAARTSLRVRRFDEAEDFLRRAEKDGHPSCESALLHGLLSAARENWDDARRHLEHSMAQVPTAEARLALAGLHLREGKEDAALELLLESREDEGGVGEIRARLADLKGRLLERRQETPSALRAYAEAAASESGWSESRRRAGLLAVQMALSTDYEIIDRELAARGLEWLEGFNDGDSVTHYALAKAAMESPEAALLLLHTTEKRVSGDNLTRIFTARLRILLRLERLDEARAEVSEARLAMSFDARTQAELERINADLLRRDVCQTLQDITQIHDARLAEIRRTLIAASELSESPWFTLVADWLGELNGEVDGSSHSLPEGAPDEVLLTFALIFGTSHNDLASELFSELAEHDDTRVETLVARLLVSLSARHPTPRDLLQSIVDLESGHIPLPFDRRELLHVAAVKALCSGDRATFEDLLHTQHVALHDLNCLSRLEAIAESENADAAGVLGILLELDATTSGRGFGDKTLDTRLARVRQRVTAMRETPSAAWAAARLRTAGKRTRLYTPEVLSFWEQEARNGNADAWHPLALMRLALAHEQEVLNNTAGDAWKAAHDAWHRLLVHEEFWHTLALRLESQSPGEGSVAVDTVRQDIPRWLLQAHLIHAKSRIFANDLPRGIEHGRLVAQSPLLPLADPRIRDEIFTSLAGHLERHLTNRRYDEALACIDHVVVADPTNPIARREAARVAAAALQQNLAMIDVLVRPPDPQTIAEVSAIMARVLALAERPVFDLAREGVRDLQTARSVATCLRARAWIAYHRDHEASAAGEALDLAIFVLKSAGLEFSALARLRSEIGLKVVEETMQKTPRPVNTRANELSPVDRALAEVDQLLILDPENVKVITQKVRLLLVKDRDADAEVVARELFKKAQHKAEPSTVRAAVELLHLVQVGREKLRYDGKMSLVELLAEQRNWRDALSVFKEATIGRENEPHHLKRHIDLLLGLHKLDPIEGLLKVLEDCEGHRQDAVFLRARFDCLRYISLIGGDLLAAWELADRGEHTKAVEVSTDILKIHPGDAAARFVLARSLKALGNIPGARDAATQAMRDRNTRDQRWIDTLLQAENTKR